MLEEIMSVRSGGQIGPFGDISCLNPMKADQKLSQTGPKLGVETGHVSQRCSHMTRHTNGIGRHFFSRSCYTFRIKVEESLEPTLLQSGHQHDAHTPIVNTQHRGRRRSHEADTHDSNSTLIGCTLADRGRAEPPPPGHPPDRH
jgi:hypothetical protein